MVTVLVSVKIFKLFAFSFLLSTFFFYLCSPFGLRVSGAAQKGLRGAPKNVKTNGLLIPIIGRGASQQ
jgi:hypothetical protein